MSKLDKIWLGRIDDIFGYGFCVLGHSEGECYKALRKAYFDFRSIDPNKDDLTEFDDYGKITDEDGTVILDLFDKAFEYWGGSIEEVDIGKVYYADFKE